MGLVAFDVRYKSHNISGKSISYMHFSLLFLVSVNSGTDPAEMIRRVKISVCC